MRKKEGFTLAEVLITLGIIGVVAAMTIPILINNNQKTQYVTALKKAYSQMNQALVQMASDNNCVGDLACTDIFACPSTNAACVQKFGTEFAKYFKVVKNCETTDLGCISNPKEYYDGSGASFGFDGPPTYRFVTADGMSLRLWTYGEYNCDTPGLSTGVTGDMDKTCGQIEIDINGLKGPNYMGRDVFAFYITNRRGPLLYPFGGADDAAFVDGDGNPYPACSPEYKQGYYCTDRIIQEGWKMNY